MLFFRKSQKNRLKDLDLEKLRQPLPGLRAQQTDTPNLSGVLGDAEDRVRQWSNTEPRKEPERVFPWEVPTRNEYQWE